MSTPGDAEQPVAASRARLTGLELPEALRILRGELGAPHLSVLPELEHRGFAGTRLARTVASLEGLSADGQAFGWRLSTAPSTESRAARSRLHSEINILADVIGSEGPGHRGSTVVELVGPLTLAAQVHLTHGEPVVADHGARRDLAEAQLEGLGGLIAQVRAATAGEPVLLRWAEPQLERVLAGQVPTSSGLRTHRAVPRVEAEQRLEAAAQRCRVLGVETVLDLGGRIPAEWQIRAFDGLAARPRGSGSAAWEQLAAQAEEGKRLWLGLSTPDRGSRPGSDTVPETARALWRTWRDLGLARDLLRRVRIEEAAGEEGDAVVWGPEAARAVFSASAQIAQGLWETAGEAEG